MWNKFQLHYTWYFKHQNTANFRIIWQTDTNNKENITISIKQNNYSNHDSPKFIVILVFNSFQFTILVLSHLSCHILKYAQFKIMPGIVKRKLQFLLMWFLLKTVICFYIKANTFFILSILWIICYSWYKCKHYKRFIIILITLRWCNI